MLSVVILAAGDSTRMGSPKALLTTADGRVFVAVILRAFAAAGLRDLIVVTGRDHARVVDAVTLDSPPVMPRFARNLDPARGQLSSLWVGMDAAVGPATEGLMVTLVDVPLLKPDTIVQVMDVWRRTRAPIVRPAIGDRHGHPVIFDRAVFDELRRAPIDAGAKTVVRAHADAVVNVPVTDEGCLVDVDTPMDYDVLRGSHGSRSKHPG